MSTMTLEPCPFCGELCVTTELDSAQGDKWGYASCGCGARGPEVRTGYSRAPGATWRAEAIKEWNNRAQLSQHAQAVDVGAIREVAASIDLRAETYLDPQAKTWANMLTRAIPGEKEGRMDVDSLAQEIRRVDGNHSLGAGALAEALMPFITRALSGEKAGPVDGWISIEERRPERNKPAIYWHKSEFGGFATIADEWRDEHHLQYATHWMPYVAPASPAPDKEGL